MCKKVNKKAITAEITEIAEFFYTRLPQFQFSYATLSQSIFIGILEGDGNHLLIILRFPALSTLSVFLNTPPPNCIVFGGGRRRFWIFLFNKYQYMQFTLVSLVSLVVKDF